MDRALAQSTVGYWSAFAERGEPRADGQPAWPAFDPGDPQWMELGDRVGQKPATRLDRFELLERHLIAPFIGPAATGSD